MKQLCEMCGDPRHLTSECVEKVVIECPECHSGTYIHSSGDRACVNAFCSWAESPSKEVGF